MSFKLNEDDQRAMDALAEEMKREKQEDLDRLAIEFSEITAQARACKKPIDVRALQAKIFTPAFAVEIDERSKTDVFALKVRTILTLMMTELNKRSKAEMESVLDSIIKEMMGSAGAQMLSDIKIHENGSVEIPISELPTEALMDMLAETDKHRAGWVRDDIRANRFIPLYAWVNNATRERQKRRAAERKRSAN